jgi:hypothetical protein
MDTSNTPTLEEFLACCQAECGFLVREHGFVLLDTPMEYNQYSVCFRKDELGVDVYGENYGKAASCDLVRGEDRIDVGLLVPVAERGVRPSGARPGQLGQVQRIAMQLQRHAVDFLGGDLKRFEAALTEWRRVTRRRPVSEAQIRDRERLQAVTAAGHASQRANYAEVVRLLQPYEAVLSLHQRRLLEMARNKLQSETS